MGQFEFSLESCLAMGRNGRMNSSERFDAIRAKLQKPNPSVHPKPKGMHATAHPDEAMPIRKIDRVRTSGVLLRGSWGPINRPRGLKCDWVHEPDQKESAPFKGALRHGPHALSRISEKWKELKK
jgi:hypothetical protein